MDKALGLIEAIGYATAMTALDAAVKAANVTFLGFERVIGAGKKVSVTLKLEGEVAAVKAAVDAGVAAAQKVGEVLTSHVIPRPHGELDKIIFSNETKESLLKPEKPEEKNKDNKKSK
ncbi:microcompartment protein [Carboxydothermus islandicus]|uniref:Microcompartment protein n=1 Tax=Carboxydothermus islandicus TaxID=661089 RepID=A0A1L8D5Y1_9THEO|nr:BMC domain-containing protein [Carboxydothermus islandicus]GAV26514.1 microcompartment protein [Carboxydothermus islandicus]